MLFTHLKQKYQFYKIEIGDLIFDMGWALQDLNITWRKKV